MLDDDEPHEDEIASFYLIDEDALRHITPEYVEGFVLGARAVWEEVEDMI